MERTNRGGMDAVHRLLRLLARRPRGTSLVLPSRQARRVGVVVAAATISALALGLWVAPTAAAAAAGKITIYHGIGISDPADVAAGPDGALWFTNYGNQSIGRIATTGKVTNYRGTHIQNPLGIAAGPDGALWFTNYGRNSIGRITTQGVAGKPYTGAGTYPVGITAGPTGAHPPALWFTVYPGTVGRITTKGVIKGYSNPGGGGPGSIAAGPDGNLWFVNGSANTIGRITPSGVITTFANYPGAQGASAIAPGPDGAMWFTNCAPGYSSIGRITTNGVVTNNYTDSSLWCPSGIAAGPDGALWFTNSNNSTIGRITTAGKITHYADPGINFHLASQAITEGADGNMWFTNSADNSIGRITTTPAPHVTLSPSSGHPSTVVQVSASNFGALETVRIVYVDSAHGTTVLASVTTDASGRLRQHVTIPSNATPGSQHVRVTGVSSRITATAVFKVR